MNKKMRSLFRIAIVMLAMVAAAPAQESHYLYKATLLQAAPGRLLELIDFCKEKAELDQKAGDQPALWMRHSQGDKQANRHAGKRQPHSLSDNQF